VIAGIGARVHLFVRPAYRPAFTALFRDVLGTDVRELDFGLPQPILLVSFPDGSAFSVEFSDLAPQEPPQPVTYEVCLHGAWIEFRAADLAGVQEKLDHAGVPSFAHPASPHRYFIAPGGQVFRMLDLAYRGP
jgi:hypothetical protein